MINQTLISNKITTELNNCKIGKIIKRIISPAILTTVRQESKGLRWDTGSSGGEGGVNIGRVEVICVVVTHVFLALKGLFGKREKGKCSGKEKGSTLEIEGKMEE